MARKTKNKFEQQTLDYLKANIPEGASVSYETEVFSYVVESNYRPDHIITFPSGHKRYIETKGYLRRQDIIKMVAIRRQYPDLDIRIFFQVNKKLSPKMKYSDWAEKYGFPYCFGTIPEDWLVE